MSDKQTEILINNDYTNEQIIQPEPFDKHLIKPKITISMYLFPEVDAKQDKDKRSQYPLHNAVENGDLYKNRRIRMKK